MNEHWPAQESSRQWKQKRVPHLHSIRAQPRVLRTPLRHFGHRLIFNSLRQVSSSGSMSLSGQSPSCISERHFVQTESWHIVQATCSISCEVWGENVKFELLSSPFVGVDIRDEYSLGGINVEQVGTGQYSLLGVLHSSNLASYSSICLGISLHIYNCSGLEYTCAPVRSLETADTGMTEPHRGGMRSSFLVAFRKHSLRQPVHILPRVQCVHLKFIGLSSLNESIQTVQPSPVPVPPAIVSATFCLLILDNRCCAIDAPGTCLLSLSSSQWKGTRKIPSLFSKQ